MLVLSRKCGEGILIGDSIRVVVVRVSCDQVRLGIEAPRDMNIVRDELVGALPSDPEGDDDIETGNPVGAMQLEELPY